ncbi:MAG: peptidoglycan DD-metalloendopeptidase family protein [Candidatus Manganitrophus sp.]|nr:peptidoglycan DD-metalloendopeptidase family protein [Candidatus Manganitrophus sp.]
MGIVKDHLVQEKEALAQKLVEIRSEKKKKDQLLARVRNEKVFYERALAELDESSLQLQMMIKKLEEEKKRLQQPASGKFSKEKGHLSWPSDGQIVSLFGRQKHPKFDTFIYKKGIEIEPSKGDEVRAVYDGTIIFANWFKGYGMVIIIDHGENYYSIYAHLAKLLVSVGDKVGRSRPIGQIGETGLSQGSNLYFEIRHQGEPFDPLTWLQKKR